MKAHTTGLALGALFALMHLCWVLLVALGGADTLLNWAYKYHFVSGGIEVVAFNTATAVVGIILAFVCGYIIGAVFAWLSNRFAK